ncbi:MAG TPA: hypothetical protein VGF28_08655 [Thermoanaerobaculia bacterium]|jgi:hypothetical protein
MLELKEIRFRSSPHVELKRLGDLTLEQREPLRELEDDPEFYGLFVPKPPLTSSLKSVTRQTADLFRSLSSAAHLDDALLGDREAAGDVIDLVLDGILELETGDGFVSGADALPIVGAPAPPAATGAAARISHDALLYAQDLETSDRGALTTALYLYNHIPASPFWKGRFPNADAVLAHVGADRGALRTLLERDWHASTFEGWLNWSSRSSVRPDPGHVTYKLYVSPRPERIRDAFEVVVRVLSSYPGMQFKIGNNAAGLLRPDKLVTYFSTRELLDEVAAELRRELAGCDAHGVPFTAALDDTGLLSWGIDPPENERALRWLQRQSWRLWVVQRLAAALSIAKSARTAAAVEPWRFALERTRRQGVDVETWTPSATLWSAR